MDNPRNLMMQMQERTTRKGADDDRRIARFATVEMPHASEGVGWALGAAYPAPSQDLPHDLAAIMKKLDQIAI